MNLELEQKLLDNLYDKTWCRLNGINYINPNITKAREIVYKEIKEYQR